MSEQRPPGGRIGFLISVFRGVDLARRVVVNCDESTSALIREAWHDGVKAVVLRVDSGGGSGSASWPAAEAWRRW